MNSDCIVDRATQVWRRLCQEMGPLLRMKTAPDVERLFSRSPAYSESTKTQSLLLPPPNESP
jgi:hypothetical protein